MDAKAHGRTIPGTWYTEELVKSFRHPTASLIWHMDNSFLQDQLMQEINIF